jgi:hypothetical protein
VLLFLFAFLALLEQCMHNPPTHQMAVVSNLLVDSVALPQQIRTCSARMCGSPKRGSSAASLRHVASCPCWFKVSFSLSKFKCMCMCRLSMHLISTSCLGTAAAVAAAVGFDFAGDYTIAIVSRCMFGCAFDAHVRLVHILQVHQRISATEPC